MQVIPRAVTSISKLIEVTNGIPDIEYFTVVNLDYPIFCPTCSEKIKVRDSKHRYMRDESGKRLLFNLKRYCCSNCRKIHTEIPDIVTPYKQYDKSTIERVKAGESSVFGGDDSTIRKWKRSK